MKKLFLSIVIIVFTIVSLNAQASFGAKAGVNFSNLSEDDMDWKSKTGFNIGLFVEVEISDLLFFQPEILFSTQGAKIEESGAELKINTSVVNIPLMIKYKAAEKFYIEAGPQIGFLTKAEMEFTYDGVSGTEDVKDDAKSIDFSLNFGLSIDVIESLFVGARYSFGLSNISDDKEDPTDIKASNISIMVGYRFN
ncbi:MAG: PorT family protein [Bacteroidetes bacterium]|nr:MAG: PorT family protein [Bacteroidota bacterium]